MSVLNQEQPKTNEKLKNIKRLWIAVVFRAVDDLFSSNSKVKNDARYYLFESADFEDLCPSIGLNYVAVREALKDMTREEWGKRKGRPSWLGRSMGRD